MQTKQRPIAGVIKLMWSYNQSLQSNIIAREQYQAKEAVVLGEYEASESKQICAKRIQRITQIISLTLFVPFFRSKGCCKYFARRTAHGRRAHSI